MREIKTKLEAAKEDRVSRYQGMNLYVKNVDDSVTDELFRETFAKYGTITSARVMRDNADQTSKGFGFVCFSNADEAQAAAAALNNQLLRSKPITVTFHQRKDVRRAQLAATYAPRGGRGFPPAGPAGVPMPYMPMYMPQAAGQQPRPFFQGQQPYPRGAAAPRGIPFNGAGPRGAPSPAQPAYGYPVPGPGGAVPRPRGLVPGQQLIPGQQQPIPGMAMQQRPRPMVGAPAGTLPRGVIPGQVIPGRGYPMQGQPQPMVGMVMGPGGMVPQGRMPVPAQGGIQFKSNVRNQGMIQGQPMQMGMMPQQQPQASNGAPVMNEPLDDQALAAADPQMQKNMIGEKLYPLIYVSQPGLAGKITGMLLEMDNAELLNLIESPEALSSKIDEALAVLESHRAVATGAAE